MGAAGSVRDFFDNKWSLYQRVIRANVLCHREMFSTLDQVLTARFGNTPFSFVDFGCGDASAVLNTLLNQPLAHYTGVDAGSELIARAAQTLAPLDCEKTLICQDMTTAVTALADPMDVMFCSYALHHLLPDQKIAFIENCYRRLKSPGYFILIDGVTRSDETREQWLLRLERRVMEGVPDFTMEEISQIMQHPRESDFPESIDTFRSIAQESSWSSFEVLFERDDFLAFLLFAK